MTENQNIPLSPKYGLNPSALICFWCRQSVGVVINGLLPNDEKAPTEICDGYDLCDNCKKSDMYKVLEIQEQPTSYSSNPVKVNSDKTFYPTGRALDFKLDDEDEHTDPDKQKLIREIKDALEINEVNAVETHDFEYLLSHLT